MNKTTSAFPQTLVRCIVTRERTGSMHTVAMAQESAQKRLPSAHADQKAAKRMRLMRKPKNLIQFSKRETAHAARKTTVPLPVTGLGYNRLIAKRRQGHAVWWEEESVTNEGKRRKIMNIKITSNLTDQYAPAKPPVLDPLPLSPSHSLIGLYSVVNQFFKQSSVFFVNFFPSVRSNSIHSHLDPLNPDTRSHRYSQTQSMGMR